MNRDTTALAKHLAEKWERMMLVSLQLHGLNIDNDGLMVMSHAIDMIQSRMLVESDVLSFANN